MESIQAKQNNHLSRRIWLVITIILFCVMCISCESISRNSHKEYVELSTKTFSSIEEVINDAQNYLDYFSKKKTCNHCEDVKNIRNEFINMKSFFEKKRDYRELQVEIQNAPFSNSSYESVRNSWKHFIESNRNSELEYEQLSTCTFHSADEALKTTQDYIDFFSHSENCLHCEEVRIINHEFYNLKKFFETNRDYKQLLNDIKSTSFSNSQFETINNTWNYLVELEKHNRMEELTGQLSKETFDNFFRNYAQTVGYEEWGSGWFTGWKVSYCEMNELDNPIRIEDEYGKKCSGIYTIHMEGAMGLGLRTGSAKYKLEGIISINQQGNYSFRKVGHTLLATYGDLHR